MQKKMHRKNQAGFTLIELMMVVTIIGILAAFAVPRLGPYREKAEIANALNTGHQILNAFSAYATTSPLNTYPPVIDSMNDIVDFSGANGVALGESNLNVFRDPESGSYEPPIYFCAVNCRREPFTGHFICDRVPWDFPIVPLFPLQGPREFDLQIALLGIARVPAERLYLRISSVEGVSVGPLLPSSALAG